MGDSFSSFYESWMEQHQRFMNQLSNPTTKRDNDTLTHLVRTTVAHYSEYYCVKSLAAERDPLAIFSGAWATSLERSLHWMADWRPTTAFHLLYSESSILFESRIVDILHGLRTGDLADLSPAQFRRVSDLQCLTVDEENAITEEQSNWQDDASEMLVTCMEVNERIENLVRILKKADDLRFRTVQRVVEVLTPKQAADFLVAAAELLFGVRGWGLNQDRQRVNL